LKRYNFEIFSSDALRSLDPIDRYQKIL